MRTHMQRMGMGILCAVALTRPLTLRADENKPAEAKPITPAAAVKVGDSARFRNTLVVSAGGSEVKVEQVEKHTVKETKDTGEVVVLIEDEGSKIDFGGMTNEMPPGEPVTLTLDKRNKALSYKPKVEETSFFAVSTQHLLVMGDRIVFPDKPVRPGDTWTSEIDNPAVKGKKVTIKTTYVGMDKVKDMPAWKFKQTMEADTEGESKLTAETIAMLDPASGQIIESEQDVKGVPTQMGAMDWKGKTQRIKPDAGKAEKKPAAP